MIDPTRLLQSGPDAAATLLAGIASLAVATAWLAGRAAKAQARGAGAPQGPPSADPRLPPRKGRGRFGRKLLGAGVLFFGGFFAANFAGADDAAGVPSPATERRQMADQSWRGERSARESASRKGLHARIEALRERSAPAGLKESAESWRQTLAQANGAAPAPGWTAARLGEWRDGAKSTLESWRKAAPAELPVSAAGVHFLAGLLLLGLWATWSRSAP